MIKTQFEKLIEASGLTLVRTMTYQLRFIVCLQVGDRYQNDTLAFGRDEFLDMTTEQAQGHIDACKRRLERAAHTQQGVICYPEPHSQIPQRQKVPVHAQRTVGYPAH